MNLISLVSAEVVVTSLLFTKSTPNLDESQKELTFVKAEHSLSLFRSLSLLFVFFLSDVQITIVGLSLRIRKRLRERKTFLNLFFH